MQKRPVIGIVGGIGSGKSFVARVLGELGCHVIDSDRLAREAYELSYVVEQVKAKWPEAVVDERVDRGVLARRVFRDGTERAQLEAIVHPVIERLRDDRMREAMTRFERGDLTQLRAFVWDSPLLLEAGLDRDCDAVIFVDTPQAKRLERVRARGWDEAELFRREAAQWPLDRKRSRASDVVRGDSSDSDLRTRLDEIVRRVSESHER
jgi:dephospho-CoA kinase